jgi:uncharacterized protein YecE (DUF72 family)
VRVLVGTSGYSYKPWKGRFYPEKLPDAEMLSFYAQRFPTVEINNTFYRMPAAAMVSRWAEQTPAGFTFVLKAPQRITHQKRLHDVGDDVAYFLDTAAALGPKLGPVLYQLPPYQKKDLERLKRFLDGLPARPPAAVEFRHASWFEEDVYAVLREHGAALCQADTDDEEQPGPREVVPTTSWGYLRLRRARYSDEELTAWAGRARAQAWTEAYVFFKHEDEARGPDLAERLERILAA